MLHSSHFGYFIRSTLLVGNLPAQCDRSPIRSFDLARVPDEHFAEAITQLPAGKRSSSK